MTPWNLAAYCFRCDCFVRARGYCITQMHCAECKSTDIEIVTERLMSKLINNLDTIVSLTRTRDRLKALP